MAGYDSIDVGDFLTLDQFKEANPKMYVNSLIVRPVSPPQIASDGSPMVEVITIDMV